MIRRKANRFSDTHSQQEKPHREKPLKIWMGQKKGRCDYNTIMPHEAGRQIERHMEKAIT